MRFSWFRALPALLVAALLGLGLLASSDRVRARGGADPNAYFYPRCDLLLQSGGAGTDSVAFNPQGGVVQPFTPAGNVAACSLSIEQPPSNYTDNGRMEVTFWDPALLAPDPTTVSLRTRFFSNSVMASNHVRADFNPPIVTRNLPNQADPRGGMLAMDYQGSQYGTTHKAAYLPDGASGTPVAYSYSTPGARVPLPGPHPVLSHAVCGGDAALQNLFVAQSVMTTNYLMSGAPYEACQVFRVPTAITLRWVEIALGANSGGGYGLVAIIDAQGATSPPASLPQPMVDGTIASYYPANAIWTANLDFDHTVVLQPNHDYFLVVRSPLSYSLYTRAYGGNPNILPGIGGFFFRNIPTGGWYAWSDIALCFRLIGEPLSAVDVPPTAPERGALQLRVAPNPSRGAAFVSWSGARGAVRFDVIDARGRRVAQSPGAEGGSEGRWLWSAAQSDGRPLPAGVYFIRARDAANHAAVERIVLVR